MRRSRACAAWAILFGLTASAASAASGSSRAAQEAAFMRTVDPKSTLNVVTGNLVQYAGTHVSYACTVDHVVQPGVVLADCGSQAEPMDVFVHAATAGLRNGERLRLLGVVEQPARWTDVSGHTVYYAFIKAVFLDPAK